MYESPVEVFYNQMRTEVDNHIYKAILDVGVDVDKEELIRAMQYDRGQYDKGYNDGIKDFAERLKKEQTTAISCNTYTEVVRVKDLDNLLKEMTEQSVNYGSSKKEDGNG